MSAAAGQRQVVLRALRADDRDELLERVVASRPLHGDWVAPPDDDGSWQAHWQRAQDPTTASLVAARAEDGALTAVFNLSQIFRGGFRNAYLGFYALEPFAGQGYTAAGLTATLHHAFDTLDLHRIEANVQPTNLASKRLVERAGFRLEGFSPRYLHIAGAWRDHDRYAMTAEDRDALVAAGRLSPSRG